MSPLVDPVSAVRLSITVGLWCAVLGFAPASALGWLMARRDFPGKSALSAALLAPLVLPPVVTGYLLLSWFGRAGLLGRLLGGVGLAVPFSLGGVVLAAFVVGFPLYVMAARSAVEAVDPRLEQVALTLGHTPLGAFRRVTLPLALPGLAAGAVLAFARALGEFGATIVLAGNLEGRTRGIALAVYTLLEAPQGESEISRLLWASLALAAIALAAYEWLWRRQRARLEVKP